MKKQTPRELLDAYVPQLPNKHAVRLTWLLMGALQLLRPARYFYKFDKREMKGRPVLLLAQHASFDDPYDVLWGYRFVMPNAIMSMHNILLPGLMRLLMADGVILKSLYEPDMSAMRHLLRLHKQGASFVLFPEGIQSVDGTTQPLHPATARLVKKLAMDTVLCTSRGAYLSHPRFASGARRGRKEYTYELLFQKDELKSLTEAEVYARLLGKFRYNDFLWNSDKHYPYRGKTPCADGIDRLLFICPRCGRQFTMHVEGERLLCDCGSAVRIDGSYQLLPEAPGFPFARIDEWYRWQQDVIAEEVQAEDFCLRYDASYQMLNLERLSRQRNVTVGEGRVTLDRDCFRYTGTKDGEAVDLRFKLSRLPSAPFPKKPGNEFYYDGVFHLFTPTADPRLAVKVLLAVEALHNLDDPVRRKACEDVRSAAE